MTEHPEPTKAKILIVEDEAIIALNLTTSLKQLGYTVLNQVPSGEKALELIEQDPPDLVLMDIVLQGQMDGIEAADIIRSRWEIPVVFTTAYADQKRLERAQLTYPFGYLIKPYQDRDIEVTLKMALYVSKVDGERRKAEEALRKSEERYSNILESIEEGYYEVDMAGNLTFFNDSLCDMLGYSRDELMGLNNRRYTDDENAKKLYQAFNEVYRTGIPVKGFDCQVINKSGATGFGEISVSPARDREGNIMGFRGIVRDISERMRAEEEKQKLEEQLRRAEKMEALGTLAGGVAHDLNNVLGIIVGFSELVLCDVEASSPLRPSLENIMSGSQKATAIVQDLLTLARRGISLPQILNLNEIIVDCLNSPEVKNLSSCHPLVKIETHLEPDLLNLSGSNVHLGKTLFNLVSNASEAMPKGGILTIKTSNQYLDEPILGYDEIREGDYVVLSVSDTGEGIAALDLNRIFEPFYTKKEMGRSGTGLGLAVVWGTVKDHQGYITVQSQEEKGSTFTLFFPVTREEITAEEGAVPISEYLGKGESILIVDDVKGQRDLAATMLRKLNYSVSTVASGEAAVTYLMDHTVDLMVLDMIMGTGMDGLDTYQTILESHPQQKVIIVSGFSETERVNTAQALGAGGYLKKPYLIEKLGLAVRKELDRST